MPPFLLHEIFPQGPGASWFFLAVLLFGVLWLAWKLLVLFGLVVAVAAACGRERLGPLDLRGVKPPSLGLWLLSLSLCVLSSAFQRSESLSWVASLMLDTGAGIAGSLTDQLLPMMVVATLVSSLYWTLVLTAARALYTMLRRPPRDARATATT